MRLLDEAFTQHNFIKLMRFKPLHHNIGYCVTAVIKQLAIITTAFLTL